MLKKFVCLILIFSLVSFAYATEDIDYIDNHFFKNFRGENHSLTITNASVSLAAGASEGHLTSGTIKSRIEFNAASICWLGETPEGTDLKVEFCALSQNGNWSEWQHITAAGHDVSYDKDVNTAYRYRVSFRANEKGQSPTMTQLNVFYSYIYQRMMREPAQTRSTPRGISKPSVVSRSSWKARSPKKSYSYHSPRRITIHHTWRPTAKTYNGAQTVRQIQNYHMDSNGWSDIGYHFLIGTYPSSGQTTIFQGRPETVIGAHTGGKNTNNVGVNVVGDYTTEALHPNSYKTLIHLLAWLCDKYNISPNEIYGHKDFNPTSCPGTNIYKLMSKIRSDVRNYNGGGGNENGTLIGAIYELSKGTSARLSGAKVTLSNGQSTTTGSDGVYRFQVKPGSYNITVSKSGFKKGYASREVTSNNTTWGSVGLNR